MKSIAWFSVVLTLALLLAGCGSSGGDPGDNAIVRGNSGLALGRNFPNGVAGAGGAILLQVNEIEQNATDLNLDGDSADVVVHAVDVASGAVSNLGVSASGPIVGGDNFVVWLVSEATESGIDRNGDGDMNDFVLAVYDPSQPASGTNPMITGIDAAQSSFIIAWEDQFAFLTLEDPLSVGDLTGDGDFDDSVLRVFNAATSSTFNTGLPVNVATLAVDFQHGILVFPVAESQLAQGMMMGTDLDGSGAIEDGLLFAVDVAAATFAPVGPASARIPDTASFRIFGDATRPFVAYTFAESTVSENQGLVPDNDLSDVLLALYDVNAGTEVLPGGGIAVQSGRFDGSDTHLAFSVSETGNGPVGLDLNSDGDTGDVIPFFVSFAQPTLANNVGVAQVSDAATGRLAVCRDTLAFVASEANQGNNGSNFNARWSDTDTDDNVLFMVNLSAPPGTGVQNLELAITDFLCSKDNADFILGVGDEAANGNTDLNHSLSNGDLTPAYFRIDGGVAADATFFQLDGNTVVQECPDVIRLVSFVQESSSDYFFDRNQDRDNDDYICFTVLIDKASGGLLGEAVGGTVDPDFGENNAPMMIGNFAVAFPTLESSIGLGQNLNAAAGDSDMNDTVLSYLVLPCIN